MMGFHDNDHRDDTHANDFDIEDLDFTTSKALFSALQERLTQT